MSPISQIPLEEDPGPPKAGSDERKTLQSLVIPSCHVYLYVQAYSWQELYVDTITHSEYPMYLLRITYSFIQWNTVATTQSKLQLHIET